MLKRFKQELIFIPAMLVLIEIFRKAVYHYFPETAMFDRGSELETYLTRVWQITWVTCGTWILLWVTFPSVHKALRDFYSGFEKLPETEKRGIALKFFFCFFFGLIFLMSGRATNQITIRTKLLDTLSSQLYVREATGKNDGPEVERYLSFVGQKQGAAWCAAFVSYNLHAVGVTTPPNPRTAWSPSFAYSYVIWSPALEKQHRSKPPQPGDCFTLYNSGLKRVAHVGFIVGEQNNYFITIEGNTGVSGSREGSGVHKYKRDKSKVYAVTDYITPYLNEHAKNTDHIHSGHSAELLRPQTHRKYRKVERQNNALDNQTGYVNTARYYFSIQSGQFKNHCRRSPRPYRYGEYARDHYGFSALTPDCKNNERKVGSKFTMQGTGRKDSITRKANHGAYCTIERQTKGTFCCKDHPSALYSEMG